MKTKFVTLAFSVICLFSPSVFAGSACQAVDAHVTKIVPWEDGAVFIYLDTANDCGCPFTNRFGFYPNDQHAKTYLAEALTAFATQSKISVLGNAGCSVHGNTPSIFTVILGGGL